MLAGYKIDLAWAERQSLNFLFSMLEAKVASEERAAEGMRPKHQLSNSELLSVMV